MTAPVDQSTPADTYGLPKLSVNGGRDDINNDRDFSRASIQSGGTITGNAFQTDGVDPRIVIDSTQLSAHRSDGKETVNINVAAGSLTILADTAASGAGVFFKTAAGAVFGQIVNDPAVFVSGGLLIDSTQQIAIISENALGGGPAQPWAYLQLDKASSSFSLACQAAGVASAISGASNRIDIFAGNDDTWSFVAGNLVSSIGSAQHHVMCALAAFTTTVGTLSKSVAINDQWGQFDHYRQVRGNSSGGTVTPASITAGAAIVNTNVSAVGFSTIRAEGAFFNLAAAAAGKSQYVVVGTAA
jgi:hypothetical protein